MTALDYLRSLDPPRFAPGHGLPLLGRFGWCPPFDVRRELVNWGYALEMSGTGDTEAEGAGLPLSLIYPTMTTQQPVAVVLDAQERAPGVPVTTPALSWDDASAAKGRVAAVEAAKARALYPTRQVYTSYGFSGNPKRGAYGGWDQWEWDWPCLSPATDLPSPELYSGHFNSGLSGDTDLLTILLNSRGQEFATGHQWCYPWLWGGESKLEQWTGFLRCAFTAGAVGGVVVMPSYPPDGFDKPGRWLDEVVALSRVQAEFSWHAEWLRQSVLLSGPAKHKWSSGERPAYEFDLVPRVLVRRHRQRREWLTCAWAAAGPVNVWIPDLGTVLLEATPAGAVEMFTRSG